MKTKYMIAALIIFLVITQAVSATMPYDSPQMSNQSEWHTKAPSEISTQQTNRAPFSSETKPPSYAPPPTIGNGDAQKEMVPVHSGLWILFGLVISYGIYRRNKERCRVNGMR